VASDDSDIEAVTFEEEDSKLPGRDSYDSTIHEESMENALAQMNHELEELRFREEEGSKVPATAFPAGPVRAIPITYVAGPAISTTPTVTDTAFTAAVAAPAHDTCVSTENATAQQPTGPSTQVRYQIIGTFNGNFESTMASDSTPGAGTEYTGGRRPSLSQKLRSNFLL